MHYPALPVDPSHPNSLCDTKIRSDRDIAPGVVVLTSSRILFFNGCSICLIYLEKFLSSSLGSWGPDPRQVSWNVYCLQWWREGCCWQSFWPRSCQIVPAWDARLHKDSSSSLNPTLSFTSLLFQFTELLLVGLLKMCPQNSGWTSGALENFFTNFTCACLGMVNLAAGKILPNSTHSWCSYFLFPNLKWNNMK